MLSMSTNVIIYRSQKFLFCWTIDLASKENQVAKCVIWISFLTKKINQIQIRWPMKSLNLSSKPLHEVNKKFLEKRVNAMNFKFYHVEDFETGVLYILIKIASRGKSEQPRIQVPRIQRIAECKLLFAGPHPISEYMDNISRVGQVVMNENLHSHENCTKNRCKHAFTVNVTKQPTKRNQMFKKC